MCPRQGSHTRYIEALGREIAMRRSFLKGQGAVNTIYFGGGTPSLLSPDEFRTIRARLDANFDLSAVEEFTVEVNPEDVVTSSGLLPALKEIGVNRISMGVQSFCERHLRWMNRRHSAATATEAFNKLREAGFENISIDLIFGFAGLETAQWLDTLHRAIELAPEHISAYQMSIDPESTLAELEAKGQYCEPDDETCAHQYAILQDELQKAGYEQYEISNFCRPGRYSRHNSAYWERAAYLGLGPAAHSFDGNNHRQWNNPSVEEYCTALESGILPPGGSETLSDREIYNEKIMLGLRTSRGVSKSLIRPEAAHLGVASGTIEKAGERFRIPRDKFFICDSIIEDYLR